jgi:hypothetical protein
VRLELKFLKPFTDLIYLIEFKSYDLLKFKKTMIGRRSSGGARKPRVMSFDSAHYAQLMCQVANIMPARNHIYKNKTIFRI